MSDFNNKTTNRPNYFKLDKVYSGEIRFENLTEAERISHLYHVESYKSITQKLPPIGNLITSNNSIGIKWWQFLLKHFFGIFIAISSVIVSTYYVQRFDIHESRDNTRKDPKPKLDSELSLIEIEPSFSLEIKGFEAGKTNIGQILSFNLIPKKRISGQFAVFILQQNRLTKVYPSESDEKIVVEAKSILKIPQSFLVTTQIKESKLYAIYCSNDCKISWNGDVLNSLHQGFYRWTEKGVEFEVAVKNLD